MQSAVLTRLTSDCVSVTVVCLELHELCFCEFLQETKLSLYVDTCRRTASSACAVAGVNSLRLRRPAARKRRSQKHGLAFFLPIIQLGHNFYYSVLKLLVLGRSESRVFACIRVSRRLFIVFCLCSCLRSWKYRLARRLRERRRTSRLVPRRMRIQTQRACIRIYQ